MGYLSTVAKIIKAGSREKLADKYKKDYLDLLYKVLKLDPREFGRFNKLEFSHPAGQKYAGRYDPTTSNIELVSGYDDKSNSFIHELAHARQYRPNPGQEDLFKDLIAGGATQKYEYRPIEQQARWVATVAKRWPGLYGKAFEAALKRPELVKGATYGKEVRSLPKEIFPPYSDAEGILNSLQYVKPYSGKGWLYGSAVTTALLKMLQDAQQNQTQGGEE